MKRVLPTISLGLLFGVAAAFGGGLAGCADNQSQNGNMSLNSSTPTSPYQSEQANPPPMPASAVEPPRNNPANHTYPPTYVPGNVTTGQGGMYPATAPAPQNSTGTPGNRTANTPTTAPAPMGR